MKQITITFNKTPVDVESIFVLAIKALFVLFLYFAMYSRYFGLFGLTGGMTASLLSAVLFFLAVVHLLLWREKIAISQLAVLTTLFLLVLALSPMVSSYIFDSSPGVALRFSIEVFVVIFIFFSTYSFIRSGIISPKFFLYAVAILGCITAVQSLSELVGQLAVGRLHTLGGLNYVGNTLAMSAVVWAMILYRNTKATYRSKTFTMGALLGFMVVFLAMLLTGTRSAAIAFFAGLMILQIFGIKSKKFKRYTFVAALLIFGSVAILAMNVDLSRLWERYTIERIIVMAEIRFSYYARAVTDLTLIEFVVGRPDLYIFHEGQLGSSRFVNTHNLFLSLIRYHGIQTFILFVVLVSVLVVRYLNLYFRRKHQASFRLTEASMFILFTMAMIYTMFSGGRPTRGFALFITLGYIVGYLDLITTIRSSEEYKKMIL